MDPYLEIYHLQHFLTLSTQQIDIYVRRLKQARDDFERLFEENVYLKEKIRYLEDSKKPISLYQSTIWTPTTEEKSRIKEHQKYKIVMCKDLPNCPRNAQCTFAHSPEELKHYRGIYYKFSR